MKKIQMQPGKRYKGYAYLNEFGQIHFDPADVGSRSEQKKLVTDAEDYTVYETKNFVVFHVRIVKDLEKKMKLKNLLTIMNNLITVIRDYDF